MKIIFNVLVCLLIFASVSDANQVTLMNARSVSTGDTVYSSSFNAENSNGFSAMLIDIGTGGGAAGVTVTQQCSLDGTTWYDPVDTDGNAVGSVYSSLTSDKYVQFDPVLTNKIRFKVVAGATVDTVTLKYLWKEN
jgi:hypothetical protein